MRKTLLTIAGFDPTSGAGVTLDLRVFRRLGCNGAALITALTAQNTRRVTEIYPIPPDFLTRQERVLSSDVEIHGIKLGMLGAAEMLPAVAAILDRHPDIPVVVDPVLEATSGTPLLESDSLPVLIEMLRGRASLLTPNLAEAALIGGIAAHREDEMPAAAEAVFKRSGIPCLLTGGHLSGGAVDLFFDGECATAFSKPRVDRSVHGTGCLLSAAVLGYLAKGEPTVEACRKAGILVEEALNESIAVGGGQDLLNL